jgi:hypothetical protein
MKRMPAAAAAVALAIAGGAAWHAWQRPGEGRTAGVLPAHGSGSPERAEPGRARGGGGASSGSGLPAAPAAAADPLPPLNTPLAAVLQDLKVRAARGETNAACRLAFELDRCRTARRLQRSVANYRSLAEQPGIGSELQKRYGATAEREQARLAETQRLCDGVPREEGADAWRYLLQAARAGHGPSMVRFANRRTLWDEEPMRILDGLIAFRSEGPALLQQAAEMGYPEAYEQLALSHLSGSNLGLAVPVDRVKGLAYYLALMRTGTPEEVARIQRMIDYAMARVLAEPLAGPLLKRNGPGTVDFTAGPFSGDNGSHCEK